MRCWLRRSSPRSSRRSHVHPINAIAIGFITIPAKVNALFLLVSFAVSGIYLSFLLVVVAAFIARLRGWRAQGAFRLGAWELPVIVLGVPVAHWRCW